MRTKKYYLVISISVSLFLASCGKNDTTIATTNTLNNADFSLPTSATAPNNNLQTADKIALGKLLFFDPILSGNKDVACASCHNPNFGYTDNLDIAIGVNGVGAGAARHFVATAAKLFTKRNTPTILNTAFNGIVGGADGYDAVNAPMFFDNRVVSLEAQSLEPIKALEEMRGTVFTAENALDSVVARLKNISQYVNLFQNNFPGINSVSSTNLAKAIAAYERTLIANNAPYDRFVRGEVNAMTTAQLNGFAAFKTEGCNKCHNGPMFSDYKLHVLSVPDNLKIATDAGNGSYAFRTPTLRNLNLTAPYMHNGAFANLADVINFYDQVGKGQSQNRNVNNNQLDANLRGLTDHTRDQIIAFLQSLNDDSFDKSIPSSVPSNLKVGGN